MKGRIVVTCEDGVVYEGEVELCLALARDEDGNRTNAQLQAEAKVIDFGLPERTFVKRYAQGMSGAKKFVLLLAYPARGESGKGITLAAIELHWNKMTSLLSGRFNRFYSATAKDNGWVDSPKTGVYALRDSWDEIFISQARV